jgi:hypothetical protein
MEQVINVEEQRLEVPMNDAVIQEFDEQNLVSQ